MFCTNCGKELENAFIMCPYCGQRVAEKTGRGKADVQIAAEAHKPQKNNLLTRGKNNGKRNITIAGAVIVAAVIAIIILLSRNGSMQDIPVYSKMDPRAYAADLYDIELFLKTEYGENALDYARIYEYLPLRVEGAGVVLVKYQEEKQATPVYHAFIGNVKGSPHYVPAGSNDITNEIHSKFVYTPIIRREEIVLPDGNMGGRVSFGKDVGGSVLWSCEVQTDSMGRVSEVYNLNVNNYYYFSIDNDIDQIARTSSIINPCIQINYDEKGRVKDISIQEANKTGENTPQTVLETEYSTQDLMESIRYSTESESGTILFKYGDRGERILSVEEGLSMYGASEIICEYDTAKRLLRVQGTSTEGEVISQEYQYKKQKRMLSAHTDDFKMVTYDDAGNIIYIKYADGDVTTYEYDYAYQGDKIKQERFFNGSLFLRSVYDKNGRPLEGEEFLLEGELYYYWIAEAYYDERREAFIRGYYSDGTEYTNNSHYINAPDR